MIHSTCPTAYTSVWPWPWQCAEDRVDSREVRKTGVSDSRWMRAVHRAGSRGDVVEAWKRRQKIPPSKIPLDWNRKLTHILEQRRCKFRNSLISLYIGSILLYHFLIYFIFFIDSRTPVRKLCCDWIPWMWFWFQTRCCFTVFLC